MANSEKTPKVKLQRNKCRSTGGRRHVPLPAGPYKVIGCRDIMTGTTGKDSGVLVRLFYPAADQSRDIREQYLLWPNWLPHENYRAGYADVGQLSSPTAIKLINWLVGSAFLPCVMNAKPLADGTRLPVIILSHGVGGCRTVSSGICLEMASNGFLVAAIEHRDGSACTTFFASEVQIPLYRSNPDLALPTVDGIGPDVQTHPKVIHTIAEEDEDSPVHVRANGIRGRNAKSFIPKTQTEWIPFETLREGDEDYEDKRKDQIKQRVRECIRAMDMIEQLNRGEDVCNVLDGLLNPHEFRDLLDTDRAVLMGHSMGGAACLAAADADLRFQAVVCLDAWMFPIHEESLNLRQPVIFINSQKFQSKSNLRKMNELILSQSDKDTTERKVVMIKGSVHFNQTDVPFVFNHVAKLLFGGSSKINPFTAHDLTCSIALCFLREHLALGSDQMPERDHYLRKKQRRLKNGFPKKL